MARPEKYTQGETIGAIKAKHGLIRLAADHLGCAPNTIRAYIRRYASVGEALEDARERLADLAEAALFRAIENGEPWAIQFYLRTRGSERGYSERVEVGGGESFIRVVYQGE